MCFLELIILSKEFEVQLPGVLYKTKFKGVTAELWFGRAWITLTLHFKVPTCMFLSSTRNVVYEDFAY